MKTFKYLFVRLILILILPVPISLPAMAYYYQTFDNGVDQFKYTLSGTMVVKGQLYRSDASTFETIKKEYKGKANLPDYNVPIKKMEISGIELKQDINHSLYIEVDNLSGSKNKEYFISVHVSFWDYDSGMFGRQMSNDISESKNKKLIKSFDIPEGADEAQINIVYYAKGSAFIFSIRNYISGEKTKYKDPCAGHEYIDSKIRFNDWYGQVMIRPDCDDDDAYEFVDYDTVIYEDDRIKTEEESGAILGLEDMSTYVIKPNSTIIIHTEDGNVSKWEMLKGTMLTNIKKMAEGKSLEIEMSQCCSGINGTIAAFEETGKESRVWLLIGKASVKNKKTGKKTVLKEGQKVTMKGETSKVEPFNVEAVAKSFGVPQDELKNHYTNKKAPKYNLKDICKPSKSNKGTKTVKKCKVKGVEFSMVKVEGGTFTMGATKDQGSNNSNQRPTHKVSLSTFYIGETEVTQELWQAVMGNNPSKFKGAKLPVENVSWNDCQQFIAKLNKLTGRKFRLPTEAEWEFAARGGKASKGYKFAGSNNADAVAWHQGNSNNNTHNVKTKKSNELGIYDMSGNVWEWCQDWFGSYSSSAQTNPKGPSSGTDHLNRGGAWCHESKFAPVFFRGTSGKPDRKVDNLGFRLVLEP